MTKNNRMRNFSFVFMVMCSLVLPAQNNLRLVSAQGELFKVYYREKALQERPQANVLIEGIKEDTLYLKLEFEGGQKYGALIYFFEQGKTVQHKEFDYRIAPDKNKVKIDFIGLYAIEKLPDPLVPKQPLLDTSSKYKNTILGHFCEMKDGKALYFNNVPKEGTCVKAMPVEYLNYVAILMKKADMPDERYRLAEDVCRNNCINISQLNTLVSYIDFEVEKLKLIRLAYFNVVDPSNQKDLEKSFRFEASRNALNDFFKNSGDYKLKTHCTCVKATEPSELEGLYVLLKACTNDSQRYDTFSKNCSAYCYNSAQVKEILQKFIHDREKLEVAKRAYYQCVDKTNFLSISEVLSYNQSISELQDFVARQQH